MKIVLFKSESDGPDRFVEELEKNDFEVKSVSSIDFSFKNLEILCDKLKYPENYEGIIFTSPRSIFATQQSLGSDNDNVMRGWSDKRNFTVGESTYNLAKNLLNLETMGRESGNALNLSTVIINNFKDNKLSKPFLFPCGNLKQDILEKNLTKHSIRLEGVEIYETIPHLNLEIAIKEMKDEIIEIKYIVFFSPSGIKYSLPFIRQYNIDLATIKLIAIGPSTKRCLEDNDLICYRMCDKPSPESLLNVLKI